MPEFHSQSDPLSMDAFRAVHQQAEKRRATGCLRALEHNLDLLGRLARHAASSSANPDNGALEQADLCIGPITDGNSVPQTAVEQLVGMASDAKHVVGKLPPESVQILADTLVHTRAVRVATPQQNSHTVTFKGTLPDGAVFLEIDRTPEIVILDDHRTVEEIPVTTIHAYSAGCFATKFGLEFDD